MSTINVANLRRRLSEEIKMERAAMIAERDRKRLMTASSDHYMGRIYALIRLGKVYPKQPQSRTSCAP